jgi:hypothetical protein
VVPACAVSPRRAAPGGAAVPQPMARVPYRRPRPAGKALLQFPAPATDDLHRGFVELFKDQYGKHDTKNTKLIMQITVFVYYRN